MATEDHVFPTRSRSDPDNFDPDELLDEFNVSALQLAKLGDRYDRTYARACFGKS